MTGDWRRDPIGSALRGENPMVLAKMKSGFAVIGNTQFLPGYCLLLAYPRVESLNRLSLERRQDFLLDMSLIGEAVEQVCRPKRVNYSIYGNKDPFLHAHIFPRYDWEPEELKPYPVWRYSDEKWTDRRYQYNEENHGELRKKLKEALMDGMKQAYRR
ncbi:diadenosine tetraphosphate (Ap4A) HIT family hydrolase [Planifilum fimeticola]|uniref:Diadenosine tetraphosphate (Ap4A) HIT family hydrolase n=1 Tax=Planifilum fimeticola TaxID=201975 RepID=A0A2T0LD19_9BACL|nr:hypothetical protein [Planifilum fimeticola]PRX39910.1 diadenosine tetraphosphate (Ap4A) HIT family hydrolase [Planifilum fimeticola]